MSATRATAVLGVLALGGLSFAALVRPDTPPDRPPVATTTDVTNVRVVAGRANTVSWDGTDGPVAVQRSANPHGPWRTVASTSSTVAEDRPVRPAIYWYRVQPAGGSPSAPVSSDHVRLVGAIGPHGGELRPTTGTVALIVPAGSVDRRTRFTIRQLSAPPATNANGVVIDRAFDIGPTGTRFDPPATLELRVDAPGPASELPADASVDARWWDDADERWAGLGAPRFDARTSTVRARIPHLSLWAAAAVTVPHGGYAADTDYCASCHASHDAAAQPSLLTASTERETCYACHDGTGAQSDVRAEFGEVALGSTIRTSVHPVPAPMAGLQLSCSDCHTPHRSIAEDTALLRVRQPDGTYLYSPPDAPIGNAFCYACHGPASNLPAPFGDESGFESSVHNANGAIELPSSGSGIKCLACHEPHGADGPRLTSAEQEDECYTCHTTEETNAPQGTNVATAFSAKGNDYATDDGNGVRVYHHPIGPLEQDGGQRSVECSSCHNVHLAQREDTAAGSAIVHPTDTSSPWILTWDANAASMTKGDVSDFCLTCHVNPTATSPVAPGPDVPYAIALADDASADADGTPHDTFTSAQWTSGSLHGPSGANLACTACHDVHGSSNAYLLRESVVSPDGSSSSTVSGFDALTGDADTLRAFCTTCHTALPVDHNPGLLCTQCHSHGSGDF
jgi:predicted CXXCH cytochrome family protein